MVRRGQTIFTHNGGSSYASVSYQSEPASLGLFSMYSDYYAPECNLHTQLPMSVLSVDAGLR